MATHFKIGQHIQGRLGTYYLSAKLFKDVWTAIGTKRETVIVKSAPQQRLDNEREILKRFRGQPCVRQLVDEVADPPCLVLKHLDDNLLHASNTKRLDRKDVKFVARSILVALKAFHEAGYVHTDIKPDNILVDYGHESARFDKVELGDCGDTYLVDCNANMKGDGHIIGAAMFRSPEAMLNMRWGTATDIWSFGATLISLIWGNGWHIFKPTDLSLQPGSEHYALDVLVNQVNIFGPVPLKYQEIADDEPLAILTMVINHVKETRTPKPFNKAEDPELSVEDREFLCRIMKFDPRDRPTAAELLEDDWFKIL